MKLVDAAKILKLSGSVEAKDVKAAYKKSCSEFHPDRNPAGEEMMKLINAAYEVLKGYSGVITDSNGEEVVFDESNYCDDLNNALSAIINLEGLIIEVCGSWVWVTGNTKPHKEILKEAGYKWANKKKAWNFRPSDWKSASRGSMSLDEIRGTHGSKTVKSNGSNRLAGKAA